MSFDGYNTPKIAVLVCQGCHYKILQSGWLKGEKCFSQFWRLGVKDQGAVEVGSSEVSLLGLQMAVSSLCPHMAIFLCMHISSVSSYKDTSPTTLGLLMTLCNLNNFYKDPLFKCSHIGE